MHVYVGIRSTDEEIKEDYCSGCHRKQQNYFSGDENISDTEQIKHGEICVIRSLIIVTCPQNIL
jgi:hypothetical protein